MDNNFLESLKVDKKDNSEMNYFYSDLKAISTSDFYKNSTISQYHKLEHIQKVMFFSQIIAHKCYLNAVLKTLVRIEKQYF